MQKFMCPFMATKSCGVLRNPVLGIGKIAPWPAGGYNRLADRARAGPVTRTMSSHCAK